MTTWFNSIYFNAGEAVGDLPFHLCAKEFLLQFWPEDFFFRPGEHSAHGG